MYGEREYKLGHLSCLPGLTCVGSQAIHRSGAVLLLALLCFSAAGQDAGGGTKAAKEPKGEGEAKAEGNNTATTTTTSQDKASKGGADDQGGKFFVNKARSTTTWTFLSSFTSIVPYTCYTTGMGTPEACMGRRLRRSRKLAADWEVSKDSARLYGSTLEEGEDPLDSDRESKEGKFFFQIWSTVSTTATVTTFSTNRSVTISVSILCTYAGITYNTC
ncbi:hypothetical protein O3P69_010720 [Scylla paramamosain]|uniref:Uncharacterized protein n=1 Tax=Scylla paramamosain TaxID=85552 RepID=A0AAW0TFY4_SCYPA